jgi:hypothetical protein
MKRYPIQAATPIALIVFALTVFAAMLSMSPLAQASDATMTPPDSADKLVCKDGSSAHRGKHACEAHGGIDKTGGTPSHSEATGSVPATSGPAQPSTKVVPDSDATPQPPPPPKP